MNCRFKSTLSILCVVSMVSACAVGDEEFSDAEDSSERLWLDGEYPLPPLPELQLDINPRITTLGGGYVGCLTPGNQYRVKGNIGFDVSCGCAELVGGQGNGTYFVTNECIDGQGQVDWIFHYGGGPVDIEVTAGCNPPFPGGSPVLGVDAVSRGECCQPYSYDDVCDYSCGHVPDGCGSVYACEPCDGEPLEV